MDLGMADAEVWGLTPRLLLDLATLNAERVRTRARHAEYLAGTVAAAVVNVQRTSEEQRVWGWTDFFPDPLNPRGEQEEEQMLGIMDMWTHHRPTRPN